MSDPLDEQLRQALRSGGDGFSPLGPLGATRTELLGRVGLRRRQRACLLAMAAVIAVGATAFAAGVGRPGEGVGSSRQVAAGGSGHAAAASTAPGPATGGTPTPGGPSGTSNLNPPNSSAVGSSPGPVGGNHGTTVVPVVTATTTPPATVAPVTPTSAPTVTVPTATSTSVPGPSLSLVRGTVLFSPVCPVAQTPPQSTCAPRPGAAHIRLLAPGGAVAAQGDAGANGQFSIEVAPGDYTVQALVVSPAATAIGRGCSAAPSQVTVKAGTTTTVAVSCDTGIR